MRRLNKRAQSRAWYGPAAVLEKIKPIANIPYIFSDRLREIKDEMIECDNETRAQAKDLKDHLSKAEVAFNRRQYVQCFFNIRNFYVDYKTVGYTFSQLEKKINNLRSEIRGDVLYKDLSKEEFKNIVECSRCRGSGKRRSGSDCPNCRGTGYQIREDSKNSVRSKKKQVSLKKDAGPKDLFHKITNQFFYNIGNQDSKSVYFWEKAFPKESGKVKNSLSSLIKESKQFLDFLLTSFDELSWARTNRKIEEYFNIIVKVRKHFWGKYNEKYFHYVRLVFQDDAKLFYSHIGLSENEVDKIKNIAIEEASLGPDDPPNPKPAELDVKNDDQAEDNQNTIRNIDVDGNFPKTMVSPVFTKENPNNSESETNSKINTVKYDNADTVRQNAYPPSAAKPEVAQEAEEEAPETVRTPSFAPNTVKDDVPDTLNEANNAPDTLSEADLAPDTIANDPYDFGSKQNSEDEANLKKLQKELRYFVAAQKIIPTMVQSLIDANWPNEFDSNPGAETVKNLINIGDISFLKNNIKENGATSSQRDVAKKIFDYIEAFKKNNPEKIKQLKDQIKSLNKKISEKNKQEKPSPNSKVAQRRWILRRLAAKLNG